MPEVVNVEETPLTKEVRAIEETALLDYLKSLSSEGPIKVTVIRETPKLWNGRNIEGTLESFEEPISEDDIRDMFGGGKYKLVFYRPNAKGSWQYLTAKKLKIAGDPKIDGLITTGSSQSTEDSPSVVRDALKMAHTLTERAQRRADEERERSFRTAGPDPALSLVMEELRAVRQDAAQKERRYLDLASRNDSSAVEMLLGKALDGESVRIQAIQARIDSELRMRADMHKAEIDRLHQRYEDIARRQEDAHKREIDNLRQTQTLTSETLKMSYEGQVQALNREIKSLERELNTAKMELTELRARKDKPLVEVLGEAAALQDAIKSLRGEDDEEKESGSAIERIIGGVMGSPLAEGIATRLAGGPAAMGASLPARQQPEPEIEVPINRPVQMPDGTIVVRKANGQVVQLRRKTAPPTPTGETPPIEIPDEDLQTAIGFMESALVAETEPSEFARAARSLAPQLAAGPVQELLRTQGVEVFLTRVAKLSPGSPLLSQLGKNWVRKVVAALIES